MLLEAENVLEVKNRGLICNAKEVAGFTKLSLQLL